MSERRETQDWVRDVLDFHAKFCPERIGTTPAIPPLGRRALVCNLMIEELTEMRDAMMQGDIPGVADGGVDLIYVVIGALLSWGIDPAPVWDAVHRANMTKIGGSLRADGKVLKPEGWQPPDILAILAAQPPLPAPPGPVGEARER
jgi:hypothetical protein